MENKDIDLLAEAYLQEVNIRQTSNDPGEGPVGDAPLLKSQLLGAVQLYNALQAVTPSDETIRGDVMQDGHNMIRIVRERPELATKLAAQMSIGAEMIPDRLTELEEILVNDQHFAVLKQELTKQFPDNRPELPGLAS